MCRLTGTIHGEYRVNVTVKDDDPISTLSVNQEGLDIVICVIKGYYVLLELSFIVFIRCCIVLNTLLQHESHQNRPNWRVVRIAWAGPSVVVIVWYY